MNLYKFLPDSILRRIYWHLQRKGDVKYHYHFVRNSVCGAMLRLKQAGFNPPLVFDIGAFEGKWTIQTAAIFPDSMFYLFEPLPDKKVIIETGTVGIKSRLFNALLGSQDHNIYPYYSMESGSGVLSEASNNFRTLLHLPMNRLDSLLSNEKVPENILMKLDVQGYELEVLLGAGTLLENVAVLVMEVSLLNYNVNAPLVHEILPALNEMGFLLFDVGEMHRKVEDHTIIQSDWIFIRKDADIRIRANDFQKPFKVFTV